MVQPLRKETMYPLNTMVRSTIDNTKWGRVKGYGTIHNDTDSDPVYLVELAEGFFSPGNTMFVSGMIWQPDCTERCGAVIRFEDFTYLTPEGSITEDIDSAAHFPTAASARRRAFLHEENSTQVLLWEIVNR
jgi:hypothetical protein